MTFTQSIKTCFSKYATFEGRASRSELWWFVLFLWLGGGVLGVVLGLNNVGEQEINQFALLAGLVTVLPQWAVICRRLHDRGLSGWWLLFPCLVMILIIIFAGFVEHQSVVHNDQTLVNFILLTYFVAICLFIWLFVMLCLPTKPEENKYGSPPIDVAVKTAE